MEQNEDDIFFEKFMITPSKYQFYKSAGDSLNDGNHGVNMMLTYFPEYFNEEQLKEDMQQFGLESIFELVKNTFQKEYKFTGKDIELNNRYQKSISSYIYSDKDNPSVIHIDELFESTMVAFFLAMFKWSKDYENAQVYENCFRYVLFLMNDVCILGEMQGENAHRVLLEMIKGDLQLIQLAGECYLTVLVFNLAHEFAHAYLENIGKVYTKQHPEKEEFDADAIAYHIVLKIIMEKKENTIKDYTYLAPMMYMDFAELIYYTDRVLYKTVFYDKKHPALKKRKERLFAVVNQDEYEFDTIAGNELYNGFLDVWDEYKNQVFLKMEKGKLAPILHVEQRERRRRE